MENCAEESGAAVRAVMERYVEAVFQADVETIRELFHPGAFMSGYLGGDLLVGTPEPFLADIGGRPSMAATSAPYRAVISRVETCGRAAVATVTESGFFGSVDFVNYFTLLEIEGEWKIVSKTFASL